MNSFVDYINQGNEIIENDPQRDQCEILKQAIHDKTIIYFFVLLIFTIGCMISNLNNIKYIVLSIYPSKNNLNEFPLLYFSIKSLSIIVSSYLLKGILHSKNLFIFLIIILLIGFISQIFGIIMKETTFYISILFAGLTHGSIMTFIILYIRYTYDLRDISTILSFITTGSALGSMIISALLFPIFYSYHQVNLLCEGTICYSIGYLFNFSFMLIALIISCFMYKDDKIKKEVEEINRINMYRNQAYCNMNISYN